MTGGLSQYGRVAAAVERELTEAEAQYLSLRLSAPKRADAGRIIAAQDDASELALFRANDEPRLL